MKQIWKIRKDNEGVSPVIATILMVAITVVLAAVLYVMVIGFTPPVEDGVPMGLNQSSKNSTAVTILVASAPNGAMIYSTALSLTHTGQPTAVDSVMVYNSAATLIAAYDGATATWTYSGGENIDSARFTAGTTISVNVASGISSGDSIVFTSGEGYYMTTTFTVS